MSVRTVSAGTNTSTTATETSQLRAPGSVAHPGFAMGLITLSVALVANTILGPRWGRQVSPTRDMWNSNSLVSWLVQASGTPTVDLSPPAGGRAPGWAAGLALMTASAEVVAAHLLRCSFTLQPLLGKPGDLALPRYRSPRQRRITAVAQEA
jgi:hypothetical protein